MAIDVLVVCPRCGPVSETFETDGERFCAKCLARHLRISGVPQTEMRQVDSRVELHLCPHCGASYPHSQSTVCLICGKERKYE